MIDELRVLVGDKWMGRVVWDRRRNRLSFAYESEWRQDPASFPLSLSMPLTASEHGHAVVDSFIWGLLPDNEGILRHWAEQYKVSPRNAFSLLWHVGEDCAGSIQFIRPDRLAEWSKQPLPGGIDWLTRGEFDGRINLLIKDHSASRIGTDTGSFSLAGAQPKTALYWDPAGKRWGVPFGTIPTTHILKPALSDFGGFAQNEHFCLQLANELELKTARSSVEYINEHPVIIVERYDRVRTPDQGVLRIHQEDMCQALGCPPHQKYQNQGGPSAAQILNLIRQYSTNRDADESRFIDSLILSWLTFGTDAHAKNYSFLLGLNGQVRLAPLYDLSSALPYPKQVDLRRAGMALKIGSSYRMRDIGARDWERFSVELKLDPDDLKRKILEMADRIPSAARVTAEKLAADRIEHPVIAELVELITMRAKQSRELFA